MRYRALNKAGRVVAAPQSAYVDPADVLTEALYTANQWNKDEERTDMRVASVEVDGTHHKVF